MVQAPPHELSVQNCVPIAQKELKVDLRKRNNVHVIEAVRPDAPVLLCPWLWLQPAHVATHNAGL